MYQIFVANKKTKKRLENYILMREDISEKLDRLKFNPKGTLGAHPLHGRLAGKWSCWLGNNIRIIYSINDINRRIIIEAVGTHKIY